MLIFLRAPLTVLIASAHTTDAIVSKFLEVKQLSDTIRPNGQNILYSRASFATLLLVLLDVIEAEGEDLEDDLKEDFGPVFFVVFV